MWKFYFWRFVHNGIAHGLLMSVYEPSWAHSFHNWSERKWSESEKEKANVQ
jgi:hypothetical protein